jgi:hypothetical protein
MTDNNTLLTENIGATWKLFKHDTGVLEVRALLKSPGENKQVWEGWGEIISGYFDDYNAFADCVTGLERSKLVKGVYVTMNPVLPALLGRAQNRLIAAGKRSPTTSDDDIVSRQAILIDADPFRPAELASTQAEMNAAIAKRDEVADWLYSQGFPAMHKANSGNGAHLVGRVDLPNDNEAKQLVNDFLECLNWKFGTVPADNKEAKRQFAQGVVNVGIDTTVYNASRIDKLYGTAVRKGDNTDDRPHRRAQLTFIPEQNEVIPAELLERIAQEYRDHKAAQQRQTQPVKRTFSTNGHKPAAANWATTVDGVEQWFRDRGVTLDNRENYTSDGFQYKWPVECMTCGGAHKDGAVVLWGADKGLGYKCHHNTCKGKGWADARSSIAPKTYTNGHSSQTTDNGFGPAPSKRLVDPDTGEILSDDAPAANGTPGSASTGQQRKKTRVSAKIDKATQIYQLALQHCQIFTGDDGAVYATVEMGGHFENMNVRSMRFRQWLGKLYYDEVGAVAGKSSCDEAVEVLSFQTGTAVKTFLRVGGTDTSFYLDLGNSQWEAVEIDANGWRILDNAPVRFRRTAKMQPLPTPVKTNVEAALVELFKLINIAAEDRMLVIAWLLAAMRHKGPYPVLTLIAEPGSAKTTTAKALKRLISPYVAETRSRPKTVEDVYVASNNDWILVYDNLSSIPLDISDAFCRMATGGGFATRELYENLEEVVIDQQQPLIINGVADIVKKGDLASRIVTVTLPTITTDNRIDESEWEKRFTDAQPRILGALLDLLSYVTAELPKVKCPLPRMADFAKLGVALDTVTENTGKPHSFAERYAESNRQGTMTIIENSPTYRPLWRFMVKAGSWDGTAASLLEELRKVSTFTEKLDLPKAGNALVKELNGIAPNLRTAQIIDIRCGRTKKGSHISLTKLTDFDRGELDNAYSDAGPESTPGF